MTKVVVSDTSVIINFLKIGRLDLLKKCSFTFFVTDHVRSEVTENYPDQLRSMQAGIKEQVLEEISVSEDSEMKLFSSLLQQKKLGVGECSAISVAVLREYALAMDDVVAIKSAHSVAARLPIYRTQDLMVRMIKEEILSLWEADSILKLWASRHRFKLKINSFQEVETLAV